MRLGLGVSWHRVLRALREVIPIYDAFNRVFSFSLDEKYRRECAELVGGRVIVDAGSGPGTMSEIIVKRHPQSHVILLDPIFEMLLTAKMKLGNKPQLNRVSGVFEGLPFRNGVIDSIVCAFSFRDSFDMLRAVKEFSRALKFKGKLVILDVGRPDNRFVAAAASIYWGGILPIMALIFSRRFWRNYTLFFETYRRMPKNRVIRRVLGRKFRVYCKLHLGGLVFTCLSINLPAKTNAQVYKNLESMG